MITGAAVFDISRDSQTTDRRAVGALYGLNDGTRVILRVGARDLVSPDTVRLLLEYVGRLHFDVQGEPRAVQAWVSALRGQDCIGWGCPA